MKVFEYKLTIETEEGTRDFGGAAEIKDTFPQDIKIEIGLPAGTIKRCEGRIRNISENPIIRVFMNGYQSWTHSPELGINDKQRGLGFLPKKLVNKYHIDRYGDYFFEDYPNQPGMFHGYSFCYFRTMEECIFLGSLDESQGYSIFRYNAAKDELIIKRDCEGLKTRYAAFKAFDLFIDINGLDEVFEHWFQHMHVGPITKEMLKGYSSWYNLYDKITEETILKDLEGCSKVLEGLFELSKVPEPFQFEREISMRAEPKLKPEFDGEQKLIRRGKAPYGDLFQIDDGWESKVGDWFECDRTKFPNGMKYLADCIHSKGLKAGLWLAPFVCSTESQVFNKHPDWLLKGDPSVSLPDEKNKYWYCGCNWGNFVSLDIDNPEVINYLEKIFDRVFNEWGFDFVKLDFLYGAAPFGNENETRAGRMIRAMDILRRICGKHPILGCGVPLWPAFGKVEYCRVSCDVSLNWEGTWYMKMTNREYVSTRNAIITTMTRQPLNGRAFLNDPDVFYLRKDNIQMKESQKMELAEGCAQTAGLFLTSDNIGEYDEQQLKTYWNLVKLWEKSERIPQLFAEKNNQ